MLGRALRICCMALNFWHSGGVFPDADLLWREPSAVHKLLFARLRSLIRADGLLENFDIARLTEVSASPMSPYDKAYVGYEVAADNTILPELEPYRDLGLKLPGTGSWDATSFLPDALAMVYREPQSIKIDRIPEAWEYPKTVAALAKVWDAQGLLYLHQDRVEARQEFELVRIFNCYKSLEVDR